MDLKDFLYERLPELYRREDAKISPSPYPLKRFLEVLTEGGFQQLLNYIEDFRRVQNIDECPKELLPLVAQQYGLEFPYDMDEASQRKFIKVLPTLYANKGTEEAFKYLAREIFGQGTNLNTQMAQKPEDMTQEEWEELGDWQKLLVYLEVDGETLKLDNKHLNFIKFCEIIRPVNTTVIPYLAVFYKDFYDRLNKSNDIVNTEYIEEKSEDEYTVTIQDVFEYINASDIWSDVYRGTTRLANNRLNNNKGLLNKNIVLNCPQISDDNLDILKDVLVEESAVKFRYDTDSHKVTDTNDEVVELNAVDELVHSDLVDIQSDIRDKVIDDSEDFSAYSDIFLDINFREILDTFNSEKTTILDMDEYTRCLDEVDDIIKLYSSYSDEFNSANIREENSDSIETVDLDYSRRNYNDSNEIISVKVKVETETKDKAVIDSIQSTLIRTTPASLLNRKGLMLNRNFRTNDNEIRQARRDY